MSTLNSCPKEVAASGHKNVTSSTQRFILPKYVGFYYVQNVNLVYSDANSDIEVGNIYRTFRDTSSSISRYCEKNYHPIKKIRSSINDREDPDYYYYEVTYSCIHGGKYKPSGTGARPKQTSFFINCPFKISVRLINQPSLHYKITRIVLTHNHEIGPSFYNLYPQQRRLNIEEENVIKNLMSPNMSVQELGLLIKEKTGKHLTSYDIRNFKRKHENQCDNLDVSDLLVTELNKLVETDDCNIHLETDENEDFTFLLIQTEMMRHLTQQLSTVLFIDEISDVNMEGYPLYAIMCEDGKRVGRPLCYIFVSNKRTNTLKLALEKFIELNPNVVTSCKIILTDKNLHEMNIIQGLFPSAINIFCTFHVLKQWIEKLSELKIKNENQIVEILKLLLNSNAEEDYFLNFEMLKIACPSDFFSYFSTDWHSCKEKYVLAYTKKLQHLGNTNSDEIEIHNQKIKTFLKPNTHINVAVKELLKYIKTVTNSLIYASFKEQKPTFVSENVTHLQNNFAAVCTQKACSLIFQEINKFQNGTYIIEEISDSLSHIIFKDENHTVQNLTSCSCALNYQYNLPCEHIFAIRFALGKEIFHKNLIGSKWLKIPVKMSSAPYFENICQESFFSEVSTEETLISKETEVQKFVKARLLTDKIATLLSKCGSIEFKEKLNFLLDLKRAWEKKDEIVLFKREEFDFVPYLSDLDVDMSAGDLSCEISNEVDEFNDKNKKKQFSKNKSISTSKHRHKKPKAALPYNVPSNSTLSLKSYNKVKRYLVDTAENKVLDCKVSLSDFELINQNAMLNNVIINAGQELIKLKFPHVAGLQDVFLGTALEFKVIETEFVQILHCQSFSHWIAASTINAPPGTVYIYDSLNETVPTDAVPQLCNIMCLKESCLTVVSKPMQIQENEVDCGLFALAAIITILSGSDPSSVTYDVDLMRSHFATCFTLREVEEFPTVESDQTWRSIERSQVFNLNCKCRQPILSNTWYKNLENWLKCDICDGFYHKNCKTRCCPFTK